jgi:hypothetical protein
MRVKTIAAAALAVLFLTLAGMAWSQMDMEVVDNSYFENPKRPPATFVHDDHNFDAEIDDCAACHHYYEDGELVEGMDSVGSYCADCHTIEAQGDQPGLMLAYHQQCKECHLERNAGPVTCGGCHEKGNEAKLP